MGTAGETQRILEALGSIQALENVSRGWPHQQTALPCAVVTLAGERRADERDGAEYLTETEYYVRCFARTGAETDALAPEIRRKMEEMGYRRTFRWEEGMTELHHTAYRFEKTI